MEATRIVEVTRVVEVTPALSDTPSPLTNAPLETLLDIGQTWKEDGAELTLTKRTFIQNALLLEWEFKNNTNQELAVSFDENNFLAKTNLGADLEIKGFTYANTYAIDGKLNIFLQPGQVIQNKNSYHPLVINLDISNKDIAEVIITVNNISRIEKAQWKIPIPR